MKTFWNKSIIRIAAVTAIILLVPLVAMQFTDEVDWKSGDFAVMGVLLFGTGLAYELLTRKARTAAHRVAIGIVLAVTVLLVWAELAVGIVGTPWAGS